jgi:hypothetical protein
LNEQRISEPGVRDERQSVLHLPRRDILGRQTLLLLLRSNDPLITRQVLWGSLIAHQHVAFINTIHALRV